MCGIAGIAGPGADRGVLEGQLRLLLHRGPDSWGVHEGPGLVIGQTRLAIIDLETGDPPIATERVGVVLNGEIYGYRELRAGLLARGHRFTTQGDTEVIAHLAEELEPRELARALDGMFAFAVHNRVTGRLTVGRDRFGKKPLFYWWDGQTLVFASELKAVLAHPDVPRRLDEASVADTLSFGYVPTPWTIYEGIRSLPPGHVLVLDPGHEPRIERYWEPPLVAPGRDERLDLSFEEAAAAVRASLTEAVRRRLVADVPLGAFLSGGIDSSAVVGIMAGLTDRPVRTFTIGFDDQDGFDERAPAKLVAERFGTDHVEFVVQPDAVSLVEELVDHHDQPFGDSSAVPTYLLSELTRKHVTVALCGDGGDELFAGYERFTAALLLRRYGVLPRWVRSSFAAGVRALPAGVLGGRAGAAQRLLGRTDAGTLHAYRTWLSFVRDEDVAALTGPARRGLEEYERVWAGSTGAHLVDRLLDLNIRTYLLDDLLPKVDRMSMAHGLEVRAPFLDADLAAVALRLRPEHRINFRGRKRVLKQAVRDLLPPEILDRPKRGFGVPLDRWFRQDLRPYVEATLVAPDARLHAHVDTGAVQHLWQDHLAGRSHGHALWTLLTLEAFLRREGW